MRQPPPEEPKDRPAGQPAGPARPPYESDVAEQWLVRSQLTIRRRWPVLLLSISTAVLLTLSFEPFNCWPLGWIALVPWLIAIARSARWGWMLFCSWLAGVAFFAGNLYWLLACGYPGPWRGVLIMAGAELALAAYMGGYFLLFAYVVGGLMRSGSVPLAGTIRATRMATFLAPVAWVGTEILRGYVMSGFAWFMLGWSQAPLPTVCQIADLGGAYAVSGLLAAFNGLIADGLIQPLFHRIPAGLRPNLRISVAASSMLVLILATVGYGVWRMVQTDTVCTPGPNVTVVQCNVPVSLSGESREQAEAETKDLIAKTLQAAKSPFHPDLVAQPETMFPFELNDSFLNMDLTPIYKAGLSEDDRRIYDKFNGDIFDLLKRRQDADQQFRDIAIGSGCALLIGAHASELAPADLAGKPMTTYSFSKLLVAESSGPPSDDQPQLQRFNSAFLYQPTRSSPGSQPDAVAKSRYDKHHLVPFSEYMPFRTAWPAAFEVLKTLTPMGLLIPGSNLSPLMLRGRDGQSFRFAAPICYEDVMPQAFRHLAYDRDGHKQVDFVVNISNDGWFSGTTELRQHLVAARFRAIENRTWIARSVNCGCSAIIDSAGRVLAELPPGEIGRLEFRLQIDPRETLYGRIGDRPGFACVGLLAIGLIGVFIQRRRTRKAAHAAQAADSSGKNTPVRRRTKR